MALQRHGPQAHPGGEDVQPLVCDEEQGVLLRGAQAPQPRQDNALALLQDRFQLCEVLRDIGPGGLLVELVGGCVEVNQQRVLQPAGIERKPPVGGIDGVALVGEGGRDHLGDESADAGQAHLVVIDDELMHHPGQKIDIHIRTNIIILYENLYLCT